MANLGPRPTSIIVEGNRAYDLIATELEPGLRFAIDVQPSQRPENFEWQQAIAVGIVGLVGARLATPGDPKGIAAVRKLLIPAGDTVRVRTIDGNAPTLMGTTKQLETGIGIVAGVVIVACVAVVASAVAWVSSQLSEVASVGLQQHGKTTQAVAAMTEASEMLEKHQEEEKRQGRDLAYDEEQLKLLQTLREAIKQSSGWTAPDLKSVPDFKSAGDKIATGVAGGQFFFGYCSALVPCSTRNSNGRRFSWLVGSNVEPPHAPGSEAADVPHFSDSRGAPASSRFRPRLASPLRSADRCCAKKSMPSARAGGAKPPRCSADRSSWRTESRTSRTRSPAPRATPAASLTS
jgi:hypothetical protein